MQQGCYQRLLPTEWCDYSNAVLLVAQFLNKAQC